MMISKKKRERERNDLIETGSYWYILYRTKLRDCSRERERDENRCNNENTKDLHGIFFLVYFLIEFFC